MKGESGSRGSMLCVVFGMILWWSLSDDPSVLFLAISGFALFLLFALFALLALLAPELDEQGNVRDEGRSDGAESQP